MQTGVSARLKCPVLLLTGRQDQRSEPLQEAQGLDMESFQCLRSPNDKSLMGELPEPLQLFLLKFLKSKYHLHKSALDQMHLYLLFVL